MTRRSIYCCTPDQPFVTRLVSGFLKRVGRDQAALAEAVIFLPTKRSAPELRHAFLKELGTSVSLLPRIHGLGEFDQDDRLGPTLGPSVALALEEIPEAISPLERQFTLMALVSRWSERQRGITSPRLAWRMAGDLGTLIDEAKSHDLDWAALQDLVPDTYAKHWEITRDFLTIVTEAWPKYLDEKGKIDARDRRDRVVRLYGEALLDSPPDHPVFIAGSTGTQPAVRTLMRSLTRLGHCGVILPGFDLDLPEDDQQILRTGQASSLPHPQTQMHKTLQDLGLVPDEVLAWDTDASASQTPARQTFLREAFRPSETSAAWQQFDSAGTSVAALKGIRIATASGTREEALIAAIALRQLIEQPGKTAIMVTTDRDLARSVAQQLHTWGLDIDDSAGMSAALSETGRFLMAIGDLALDPYAPVPLLALLQHPFCRVGRDRAEHLAWTRDLDQHCLRGPRPAAGADGLLARVRSAKQCGAETEASLEAFLAVMEPFTAALFEGGPVGRLLTLMIQTAEALAAGPGGDGQSCSGADLLWDGDAGRALSDMLSDTLQLSVGDPESAGQVTGAGFTALVREWIEGVTVRSPWPKHPRIRILSPQEARLMEADLVILGGVNEGSWPQPTEPDPWLNRDMRKALGLPDPAMRVGQSAHDMLMALHAPNVLLTRSLKTEGSPTVPSRWIYRLEALAGGPLEPAEDLMALARQRTKPARVQAWDPPTPTPPVSARPRRLSVTQVELWMRDPYSLYARKILGLVPLEPVDDSPTAAKKGTLLHDALEAYLKGDGPTEGEAGLARLIGCGRDAFRQVETQPTVYAFWWPRFLAIADWFVAHEADRAPEMQTLAVEAWGELVFKDINFTLFAKADRIDLRRDDGTLEIIDYKTGVIPTKNRIEAGFAPQMPLEGLIAEAGGFDGLPEKQVADLVFWKLIGGQPVHQKYAPIRDVAAALKQAEEGLVTLVRAFDAEGVPYLPNPWPVVAGYGDYDHLARVGEWTEAGDGFSSPHVVPFRLTQKPEGQP